MGVVVGSVRRSVRRASASRPSLSLSPSSLPPARRASERADGRNQRADEQRNLQTRKSLPHSLGSSLACPGDQSISRSVETTVATSTTAWLLWSLYCYSSFTGWPSSIVRTNVTRSSVSVSPRCSKPSQHGPSGRRELFSLTRTSLTKWTSTCSCIISSAPLMTPHSTLEYQRSVVARPSSGSSTKSASR